MDFFIFAPFLSMADVESCAKADTVTINPVIKNPLVMAAINFFILFLLWNTRLSILPLPWKNIIRFAAFPKNNDGVCRALGWALTGGEAGIPRYDP
jgi:hypothetical protein